MIRPSLAFALLWIITLIRSSPAEESTGSKRTIRSGAIAVDILRSGQVVGVRLGDARIDKALTGQTLLAGCHTKGEVTGKPLDGGGVEFTHTLVYDKTQSKCGLIERFMPTADSVRWEIEIRGLGEPWSTPIETHLSWPDAAGASLWTAWADPNQAKGTWHDPLVSRPFEDRQWYYGAPPFEENNPLLGYCPFEGNVFSIPIVSVFDSQRDVAFSVVLSPEDDLLDLILTTDKRGQIVFSRINHRISSARPVRFAMDLIAHPADWRCGLSWMTQRYPKYFDAPNPLAYAIVGCGAYSSYEGELDVEKCMRMAFRVNWKASYDFPYMGMFIPPVKSDSEEYPRFMSEGHRPRTSIRQMADYSRRMRADGFHVLSYFNVTELGTALKGPNAVNKAVRADDLWKNANDFLYTKIADGILPTAKGGTWGTWGGAIAMDPGGPNYQAFLLEQARRHIEKIPASDGVCIDRLDWLRFFNPQADDGLSWHNDRPMRSLFSSWRQLMTRLGPLMHQAGKVIFVNNHLKRLDVLRDIDGIYCEFAQAGTALNGTGLLCVRRPAIGWTASELDLRPDPDAFFQRQLHMGVFPTAPLPHNDHTINPTPYADRYYLDYGPLLDTMRGRRWVLRPHVVEVEGNKAKANLFEVPGGLVMPITFGKDQAEVRVVLRGLSDLPGWGKWKMSFIHPGGDSGSAKATWSGDLLKLDVPLKRGCAVVRLSCAWIAPSTPWFYKQASVELGTVLDGAEIRYTLDGSEPRPGATLYSAPLTLDKTTTVKAAAFRSGRRVGDVLMSEFVKVRPMGPVIRSASGGDLKNNFEKTITVAIIDPSAGPGSAATPAAIRYTTDGSTPTSLSSRYSGPITLSRTTTIRARVFLPGAELGFVSTATFGKVPPPPPPPDIHISDLKPIKATVGWGDSPKVNRSIQGNPLMLCGKRYEKGMGVHATSELVYRLEPQYKAFVATVGVDDEMQGYEQQSVVFQVFADERKLTETPILRRGERSHINVPIPPGCRQIRLIVTDANDGVACDHGNWVQAGFLVSVKR